jgi:hypothetical protein
MKEAIRRIQSRGIFIVSGMIVGFDADDHNIFRQQSEFLIEAGLAIPMLGMLMAPRGTKLWERLEKEGRLFPHLDTGDMFAVTNLVPKLMAKEELEQNYIQLLKEVFSYPHFLKCFKSLIDQVDLNEVKKNSPLAEQMKIGNFRFYYLKTTLRLIGHYLFNRDKEKRKLFISALKIALSKGVICFPWVIELLLYFKAEHDFVEQHKMDYSSQKGLQAKHLLEV